MGETICARKQNGWGWPRWMAWAGLWLASGAAQALPQDQALAQFHRTHWSLREGAPGAIAAITQSPDGYLWLGSGTGLVRFDGVRFQRYDSFARPGQALPSLSITALKALPDGRLAIGYRYGGISLLQPDGTLISSGEPEGLIPSTIYRFAVDSENRVWAATGRGLVREQGRRWERMGPAQGVEAAQSYDVQLDPAGGLWLSTELGIFHRKPGATSFGRVDLPVQRTPLMVAPDGRVWAYSQDDGNRLGPVPRPGEDPAPLRATWRDAGSLENVMFDRDGSLWMLSTEGTKRIARPAQSAPFDTLEHTATLGGQPEGSLSGFEDREGNVWIGTTGGLDRYRINKLSLVTALSQTGSIGLAQGDDGAVWAMKQGLGVVEIKAGQVIQKLSVPEVTGKIHAVYREAKGRLWLGGWDGLWRVEGGKATAEPMPPKVGAKFGGRISDTVHAVTVDAAGGLWLAVAGRSVYHRPAGGAWQTVGGTGQVPKASPLVIQTDPAGRVWLGFTRNRLVRQDGEGLQHTTVVQGLRVGNVLSVLALGDRTWVGGEGGLAVVDAAGAARALQAEEGDALVGVTGIVQTAAGDLWINGAFGVTHIAAAEVAAGLRDPAHLLRVQRFDHRDGLTGVPEDISLHPTAFESSDGRLWFALTNGLVMLDPAHVASNALKPPVVIESLQVDGRSYPAAQGLALPELSRDLSIDYTALSLAVPERVNFRYRLDGVDGDWQEAGTRRTAFYTRLAPGDYSFRVAASNNDGVWNEAGSTLRFRIPPAFYQTTWFRVLCGLALLAGLWGLHRLRLSQMAASLRGRLEARLMERERIARELHDTLLQGFHGLMLRFQTATDRIPSDAPARALMEAALDRADAVLIEGRHRVLDLRLDEEKPLAQALAGTGEALALYRPVTFALTEEGLARALKPGICDAFLRIANEALANAFKHARAARIEVALHYDADRLRLQVWDDGTGIDETVLAAGQRPGHWGLAGMRERAAQIGATLTLSRRADGGTEVDLQLPAAQAYAEPARRSGFAAWGRKKGLKGLKGQEGKNEEACEA